MSTDKTIDISLDLPNFNVSVPVQQLIPEYLLDRIERQVEREIEKEITKKVKSAIRGLSQEEMADIVKKRLSNMVDG